MYPCQPFQDFICTTVITAAAAAALLPVLLVVGVLSLLVLLASTLLAYQHTCNIKTASSCYYNSTDARSR